MKSVHPEAADNSKREQPQRRMRRTQVGMAVFATFIGLISFFGVAGNPRFETYHTLDVIRLMTAGAGFGVALVLLIQFFQFGIWREQHGHLPGTRSEAKKE
jgi:hypothetical protein